MSCIGDSRSRPAAGCTSEHLGEPTFRKRIAGLHAEPVGGHRRYDGAAGAGNPRAKLTDDKVRTLRALRAGGLTYRQLAAEFGISDVSACAAVNRKTWAHVT